MSSSVSTLMRFVHRSAVMAKALPSRRTMRRSQRDRVASSRASSSWSPMSWRPTARVRSSAIPTFRSASAIRGSCVTAEHHRSPAAAGRPLGLDSRDAGTIAARHARNAVGRGLMAHRGSMDAERRRRSCGCTHAQADRLGSRCGGRRHRHRRRTGRSDRARWRRRRRVWLQTARRRGRRRGARRRRRRTGTLAAEAGLIKLVCRCASSREQGDHPGLGLAVAPWKRWWRCRLTCGSGDWLASRSGGMPAFVAHVWPGDATLRAPPDAYGATSAGRGAGQRRLLTTSDPWSRCVAARSGARLARLTSSRDGVQPSAGTGNLCVWPGCLIVRPARTCRSPAPLCVA
jgi:hypothetical protein